MIIFLFHQKMRKWHFKAITKKKKKKKKKKREKNLYPFKQEARKTKCWVQVDPLMHLSVKG